MNKNITKLKINSFKDLLVWQKAMDISVELYKLTANFPQYEVHGLTNQIRRASNSISLNIAEGHGQRSTKSYINHLNISRGSLSELESGLLLGIRLGFTSEEECTGIFELISEENKMLTSLMVSLEDKINE